MLDDIRFLTNPSSGLTGFYIAQAFLQHGYSVHILAGKFATTQLDLLQTHPQCIVERLSSNEEFASRVDILCENAQLFIASAALCDFEFEHTAGKIKKSKLVSIGQLSIKPAQDILQLVLSKKIKGLKTIGFAAETSITPEILDEKWQRKPTNLLVANIVKNSYDGQTLGFRQEDGNYLFKDKSAVTQMKKMSKNELAAYLVSWYEQL